MDFKPKNEPRLYSIKEFKLKSGFTIGVFQGSRGKNPDLDIIIKYQQPGGHVRTPQHLHWAIDLLIKKEHDPAHVREFVSYLVGLWDKVKPFANKQEQQECKLNFVNSEELKKFEGLDAYGEYSVEFIAYVVELLMIQEKNADAAFMFKGVLEAIRDDQDIFSIVSAAAYGGRG